ncbi:hypothetical protein NM22_16860 [Vibrio tubiashii]|nr:hypothetical protein NM22_16860 [Vibrio tubiashii]
MRLFLLLSLLPLLLPLSASAETHTMYYLRDCNNTLYTGGSPSAVAANYTNSSTCITRYDDVYDYIPGAYDNGKSACVTVIRKGESSGSLQYCEDIYVSSVTCSEGQEFNPTTGSCETPNNCEPLAGNTKSTTWDYTKYGDSPTFCSAGCELKTTGSSCFLGTGGCGGTVVITGQTCSDEGTSPGGNIPDSVPQGCQDFNGTYLCPKDSDGDGQPDAGQPIDTSAKCGYGGNDKFSCHGGTYEEPDYEMQDPTKPLEGVESNPLDPADTTVENVEGVSDPTQQSDERAQILLMNKQINSLLEALNSDNNANFKKVVDELKNSNEYNKQQLEQIVNSTNKQVEVWNELKALQKTGTEDLVNAINGLDDYDEHYHNQQMSKLNDLISAVNGIGNGGSGDSKGQEILDSISNVEAAIDGTSATYTSQHDDESLKTTMVNRLYETKNKIHDGMLDAFVSIDLSGASRPSFALDMNGFGFGTYDMDDYVNFDYIFGFIRICILFTAAMLCRKLIFGG